MNKFVSFFTLALLAVASASQGLYSGHQVYKTSDLSGSQVEALRVLEESFDFWKPAMIGRAAEVRVAPEQVAEVNEFLAKENVDYEIKIEDVQEFIESTQPKVSNRKGVIGDVRYDWDDYKNHDEMNAWIQSIADDNKWANIVNIGTSEEGRQMNVLEIRKAGDGKKTVFIEAGIHAREWISPAVGTYTINQLLTVGSSYLDEFNVHFLPSANPDGYEYTISNDRLWRKNRGDYGGACKGVDLNRNWGFHFAESGVSNNHCSDVYCGAEAFSSAEATNIRDYYLGLKDNDDLPEAAICFHSAADLWLYPYGYASDSYPDNVEEVRQVCEDCVDALNSVNGQKFQCINSAELYPAAGASDDWYMSLGTRFVYTPELRDGGYGFLLPPQYIKPSGEEVWAAMKVILDKLLE